MQSIAQEHSERGHYGVAACTWPAVTDLQNVALSGYKAKLHAALMSGNKK